MPVSKREDFKLGHYQDWHGSVNTEMANARSVARAVIAKAQGGKAITGSWSATSSPIQSSGL